MGWILIVLGAAVLSWLVLGMLFIGFPTVERLKDQKDEIPMGWVVKIPIYVAIPIFLVADTLFNWTWGTWVFREFPREFLYTHRLKRQWYYGSKRDRERAEPWVKLVNLIDPGHV